MQRFAGVVVVETHVPKIRCGRSGLQGASVVLQERSQPLRGLIGPSLWEEEEAAGAIGHLVVLHHPAGLDLSKERGAQEGPSKGHDPPEAA